MEENKIIQEMAAAGMEPKTVGGGVPFVVVPNGHTVFALNRFLKTPTRIQQLVTLDEPQSFIDYYNLFADEGSQLFVDREHSMFVGVLDYHYNNPAWCDHRVTYTCPLTVEWRTWAGNDGKWMNQVDFALFVERNLPDFMEPAGDELLSMVTTFQEKRNVQFSSSIKLSNGARSLEYKDDDVKGSVRIPTEFKIAIPIYQGAFEADVVRAFLRTRVKEGSLSISYELDRPHKAIEAAFNDVLNTIIGGTNAKPFMGTIGANMVGGAVYGRTGPGPANIFHSDSPRP